MTREETQKLLLAINSIYPNFKIEDKTIAINSWHWALQDYPADAVKGALAIYVKTNNTGFAPSVSQLIGAIHAPKQNEQLTEGEAWHLVKKAMNGSAWNAQDNFDKLPPLVQRAIGSATVLRQWGMTDSDEVNTVIMSNFQRTYKALLSKQEFNDKVPMQLSELVKGLADKVSGNRYLGIESEDAD